MAVDKSVLDFPEVTDADENDVVYVIRGVGSTRDKHQKAVNFFKNGAIYSYTDKTGVYSNIALQKSVDEVISGLELVPDALMDLKLQPGAAVSFSGHYYDAGTWGYVPSPGDTFSVESTEDITVTIPVADVTNPRIDVVEVRPIKVDGLYTMEVQVLPGTPGGYPAAPAKTAGWIKLSEVYVEFGATTISIEKLHNVAGSYAWRNEAGTTIDDGKLYADYTETIPVTYNTFDYLRLFNRLPLDWNGHSVNINFTNATYTPPTGFEIGTQSRKNGTLSMYGDSATINMSDMSFLNMSNFKDINVYISSFTIKNGGILITGSNGKSNVGISVDFDPEGSYQSSLDIRQVASLDASNSDVSDTSSSNQDYAAIFDDIPLIKGMHTISGANLPGTHSILINCQVEDSDNLSAGTVGRIHRASSSKYTILDQNPNVSNTIAGLTLASAKTNIGAQSDPNKTTLIGACARLINATQVVILSSGDRFLRVYEKVAGTWTEVGTAIAISTTVMASSEDDDFNITVLQENRVVVCERAGTALPVYDWNPTTETWTETTNALLTSTYGDDRFALTSHKPNQIYLGCVLVDAVTWRYRHLEWDGAAWSTIGVVYEGDPEIKGIGRPLSAINEEAMVFLRTDGALLDAKIGITRMSDGAIVFPPTSYSSTSSRNPVMAGNRLAIMNEEGFLCPSGGLSQYKVFGSTIQRVKFISDTDLGTDARLDARCAMCFVGDNEVFVISFWEEIDHYVASFTIDWEQHNRGPNGPLNWFNTRGEW